MLKTLKLTSLLLAGMLVFAGCGPDDDPDNQDEPNQNQNDNGDELVNLAATAEAQGSFSTLLTAVEAAGLTEALEDESNEFTLFAPTDDAFADLDDGVLDTLLAEENQDDLIELLQYHLIAGTVTSEDVAAGQVETVAGIEVEITVDGDDIFYGGAPITGVDLMASNGVIHTLGEVAIPETEDDNGDNGDDMSILDIVADSDDFTILAEAATRAGLTDALDTEELTVFAPTDDAFENLGASLDDFSDDELADILLYHVLAGTVMAADVELGVVQSFDNRVLLIGDDPALNINGSAITDTDIEASNGVIHVIDEVIVPPGTIADVAMENDDLSSLVDALVDADLVGAVDGEDQFTVFAPTNQAFDDASAVLADASEEELQTALLFHAVVDAYSSYDIEPGMFATAAGVDAEIAAEGGVLTYAGAEIIVTDVVAENGIVHVIDAVVLPPE